MLAMTIPNPGNTSRLVVDSPKGIVSQGIFSGKSLSLTGLTLHMETGGSQLPMQITKKLILLVLVLLPTLNAHASQPLPAAIKGFCNLAFAGKIALPGRPFNAGDAVNKGIPSRRILGYLVGEHDAYIWYEHGGRHYHQHLVKFSKTKPYEVKVSYVFDRTRYRDIHKLVKDKTFLASHLRNQCGL